MTTDCYTCTQEAQHDGLPARERIAADDCWRVAHAFGTSLPGWLVLVPRRHVMTVADLSDAEAQTLGVWQLRLARALREGFGAQSSYVMQFGEAPGVHLHFHVVPRAVGLAAEFRGPGIFGFMPADGVGVLDPEMMDDVSARLAAVLQ